MWTVDVYCDCVTLTLTPTPTHVPPPHTFTLVPQRVSSSGALPISRDTSSYVAIMSVLHGGAAGQLEYVSGVAGGGGGGGGAAGKEEKNGGCGGGSNGKGDAWDPRAEAKRAHADRMAAVKVRAVYSV